MTFDTMSDLIKASDTHTHECIDLSGSFKAFDEDENETNEFTQIFVMKISIAGLWHYFNEIKANGIFGARAYQLIMTSIDEI